MSPSGLLASPRPHGPASPRPASGVAPGQGRKHRGPARSPGPPAPPSRDPAPLSLLPYRRAVACLCAWSLARSIPSLASYRVSLKQWICSSLIHCDAVVEVVWRHLLVGAREGRRRWPSVTALAQELGVAVSTTHRSLAHPVEIGAVDIGPIDGMVVLDPARLLVLLAAHRHVQRDLVRHGGWPPRDRSGGGGQERHGGAGRVRGGGRPPGGEPGRRLHGVLFYGDPKLPRLGAAPEGEGTEIWVAEPHPWLRRYGRVTPLAQAYADLFSMPGWQPARFIEQLHPKTVATCDEPLLLV